MYAKFIQQIVGVTIEWNEIAYGNTDLQPYCTERLCFKRIATIRELTALRDEIKKNRARVAKFKPLPRSMAAY